ncbi:hypothetical protein SKA58_06955 [Sphingomonas sp. SKA58]|jgi:hypothetical protein|nr:hypothetical protein SKA58_06955 [Sphingomonas sp. SKA58]|tara:strand:+ start:45 stop:158 length:114 start_codon:yes stop_codon:yes gene_type:complete
MFVFIAAAMMRMIDIAQTSAELHRIPDIFEGGIRGAY